MIIRVLSLLPALALLCTLLPQAAPPVHADTSADVILSGRGVENLSYSRTGDGNEKRGNDSDFVILSFEDVPSITTQPEDATVALGKFASFTVAATGGDLSYQWQYQRAGRDTWNDWADKTSATLTFHGTSTNNNYKYRRVVTNAVGSVRSDAATLTIVSSSVENREYLGRFQESPEKPES